MSMSYSRRPSDVPAAPRDDRRHLRRTVERFGDREAVVVGHQHYRAGYRELWLEIDSAARRVLARWARWATAAARYCRPSGSRSAASP